MGIYHSAVQSDPELAEMSLADFAARHLPNNEMVRLLSNKGPTEDLTDGDLYLSMEILRRKCVVGLVDRMEDSMVRFHGYFGWFSLLVEGVAACQAELLAPATQSHAAPVKGSEAYNNMIGQNRLDLRLYDYAQYLYDVQGGNTREAK